MALTTQAVITSLIEKYGNKDGDIVGLTQDELIRAFQQVNSQPTDMPKFLGSGETEWKKVSQSIAQFLNRTHMTIKVDTYEKIKIRINECIDADIAKIKLEANKRTQELKKVKQELESKNAQYSNWKAELEKMKK